MDMQGTSWLNLESGAFLGVLLATAGIVSLYYIDAPIPRSPGLARSKWTEENVRKAPPPLEPRHRVAVDARDPFVPYALGTERIFALKPPDPKTPDPKTPVVKQPEPPPQPSRTEVVLPSRPDDIADTRDPDPIAPEKTDDPLPVLVKGFTRLKNERRVLLALRDDPGRYFTLGEGEEWAGETESLKVLRIEPSAVVFQRANGRVQKVDKNPLTAWKPKLRDPDEAVPQEDTQLDPRVTRPERPLLEPNPQPVPDQQPDIIVIPEEHSPERQKRPQDKESIEDILKGLKNRPDAMEKLGDVG